jgi:hypothetical protein
MASLRPACRPCLETWRSLCAGSSSLHNVFRSQAVSPFQYVGPAARPSRWYSSASTASSSSSSKASADDILEQDAIKRLRTQLSESQPCFSARGDEVEVLTKPATFHETLLVSNEITFPIDDSHPDRQHVTANDRTSPAENTHIYVVHRNGARRAGEQLPPLRSLGSRKPTRPRTLSRWTPSGMRCGDLLTSA